VDLVGLRAGGAGRGGGAVGGLRGGERATLDATWTAAGGAVWASRTPVRANGDGALRLAGVDGMRFLWAMRPVHPTGAAQGFDPRVAGRSDVRLSLVAGGDTVIPTAGLLAAHGYPALALAYFKAPGLPSRLQRIPLEYFARAARILRRDRAADPRRVVAMGGSYGGEAALLIAATFPRLFHGAIGLVPNVSISASTENLEIPAWSYRGRGLEPVPIALGRIDAPILVAGAGLDNVWDSALYVQEIDARRADAHTPFHDASVAYAKAGHDVGAAVPYLPQSTDQAHFGGTARASAAGKADLWPRILRYLRDLPRGPA
jgi:dienelactone hydrolase